MFKLAMQPCDIATVVHKQIFHDIPNSPEAYWFWDHSMSQVKQFGHHDFLEVPIPGLLGVRPEPLGPVDRFSPQNEELDLSD